MSDMFEELRESLKALSNEEFFKLNSSQEEKRKAFFLAHQIAEDKFCTIKKDREWLAEWSQTNPIPSGDEISVIDRVRSAMNFEFGRRNGWWEDWNENEPIPFPKTFKIDQFGPNGSFANILVDLGVFSSLTQARKNGFDKPLEIGDFTFGKKRVRARVVA